MSPLAVLIPILLPIAGGLLMLPMKMKEKNRNLYCEILTVLTSLCVWAVLLWGEPRRVEIFSFIRGFSVDFCNDGLAKLFAGMISVMWPLVMLYAFEYMSGEKHQNSFFSFYVMTYGVTLGVAFASNTTTLYVFYEMLSLITIPLVTHYQDHGSMYAGRKYAAYTMGGAALAFFAVIVSTLYGNAGNFTYGGSLNGNAPQTLMQIAFLFAFLGFGVKAAIFPFHDWLPSASVAPTPVTALLHAVAVVNSGVFAVIRMTYYTFGAKFLDHSWVQTVGLVLSSFTLIFAAVMAIRERHFKRRLAYSTVSNLSYMLFGIMLLTPMGYAAGLSHMVFHSVIKMSMFLCAGAFMEKTGKEYLYEVSGVGKRMPVTFICYTLGALSLTGIPLFCGFISKWNLLQAGAEQGSVWGLLGVGALIASAFLCAVYTLSVSVRAFFPQKENDLYLHSEKLEAGKGMLIPIVFFTVINLALGLFPDSLMTLITQIAEGLF